MFGFFGSTDKRIILINIEGLSVYSLHKNLLVHVTKFSDEDSGYDNFRVYLQDNPRSPVTLVVDSALEDFIVEPVSHVRSLDQKSFLRRKAEQHFRGAEYSSAKIIGRETSGRRDDKVLFSALTKNQIIEPWIKVLLRQEIPIKSITTPAYALCKVAEEFSLLTSEHVLLVNWEVSGIRQTYIADGKLMFSRLTPLPPETDSNLAAAIIESCNQSKEYLEHIELLEFGQKLDVHIITPILNDESFADQAENTNFGIVMHHNSIDLMQIDRFSGPQASITAILLCLDWGVRSGELKNIYAPSQVRRFFELIQIRRLIAAISLGTLLLGGLLSLPLILDGLERRDRTAQLAADIIPVQAQYDALRAQFPGTPIPSAAMELAVRTYDIIRMQARSPTEAMVAISEVIAEFPLIEISSLYWTMSGEQASENLTTVLLNEESSLNLELYGFLLDSSSIQESDRQMRELIDALNEIEGMVVSPISLPVEPGPFAEVNTVIDDEVAEEEFALNVSLDT